MQLIKPLSSNTILNQESIILCGGIDDIKDGWRTKVIRKIERLNDITIINPQVERKFYKDNEDKITCWEFDYLRKCNQILFWFIAESSNSWSLFELAATLERNKIFYCRNQKVFVGIEKGYKLKKKLEQQVKCINPEIIIAENLDELCAQVINWNF